MISEATIAYMRFGITEDDLVKCLQGKHIPIDELRKALENEDLNELGVLGIHLVLDDEFGPDITDLEYFQEWLIKERYVITFYGRIYSPETFYMILEEIVIKTEFNQ